MGLACGIRKGGVGSGMGAYAWGLCIGGLRNGDDWGLPFVAMHGGYAMEVMHGDYA